MEWGVTGPNLRACGLEWDLRKKFPYSAYERFDFDVPHEEEGDLLTPATWSGSRRCARAFGSSNRPPARCRPARHNRRLPLCHPREKGYPEGYRKPHPPFYQRNPGTEDPRGEAYAAVEIPRGEQGYYVVSDGLPMAYRMRIRTPGFANMQAMPLWPGEGCWRICFPSSVLLTISCRISIGRSPEVLSQETLAVLRQKITETDHPRELAVEVMFALQKEVGYLSDEALQEGRISWA